MWNVCWTYCIWSQFSYQFVWKPVLVQQHEGIVVGFLDWFWSVFSHSSKFNLLMWILLILWSFSYWMLWYREGEQPRAYLPCLCPAVWESSCSIKVCHPPDYLTISSFFSLVASSSAVNLKVFPFGSAACNSSSWLLVIHIRCHGSDAGTEIHVEHLSSFYTSRSLTPHWSCSLILTAAQDGEVLKLNYPKLCSVLCINAGCSIFMYLMFCLPDVQWNIL